jgi:hypothetical protein
MGSFQRFVHDDTIVGPTARSAPTREVHPKVAPRVGGTLGGNDLSSTRNAMGVPSEEVSEFRSEGAVHDKVGAPELGRRRRSGGRVPR